MTADPKNNNHDNNIVPLRPDQPSAEPTKLGGGGIPAPKYRPKVKPWTATLPKGAYAPRPIVRDGTIDGRNRVMSCAAIDYIAARNGITAEAACMVLQDLLTVGRLHAKDPAGKTIPPEWWQHAAIDPEGGAKHTGRVFAMIELPWFTLDAAEVLAQLPPPPPWVVTYGPAATTAEPQTPTVPATTPPDDAQPSTQTKRPWNMIEARFSLKIPRYNEWKDSRPKLPWIRAFLDRLFENVPNDRILKAKVADEVWKNIPPTRGRSRKK
jgi:hypothetical protein